MRTESEVAAALELYGDMVKRICMMHLKNQDDTEDIFQEVFIRYMMHDAPFMNQAHEKSWFARVTINACKDLLKSFFRKNVDLKEAEPEFRDRRTEEEGEETELLHEILLALPEKYRDVIYLYYYEEYSALEIAQLLGKKENTIYTLLSRGRQILKEKIGGQWQ